jgi:hypothetical protein
LKSGGGFGEDGEVVRVGKRLDVCAVVELM